MSKSKKSKPKSLAELTNDNPAIPALFASGIVGAMIASVLNNVTSNPALHYCDLLNELNRWTSVNTGMFCNAANELLKNKKKEGFKIYYGGKKFYARRLKGKRTPMLKGI